MKKIVFVLIVFIASCKVPALVQVENKNNLPANYIQEIDSNNMSNLKWKDFFADKFLIELIDTAIKNNYEVLSTIQNIEIAKKYIRIKHADLLPRGNAVIGLGLEKTGRYTAQGAGNASTEILPGKEVPEPIADIFVGLRTSWEADIWGKLHNAKKIAVVKYLQSIEGKNFIFTNLVAEVANSYYELIALDNQLEIIKKAIELQKNQLEILRVQKLSARANELAVKQFEAQVYNSQSQEFEILQNITLAENKINYLLGRYPQKIERDSKFFDKELSQKIQIGIPAQLLQNRPDIRSAELELQAANFDVQIARAEFYPSVGINGVLGFQGFKPKYILPTLENLAFSFVGDLTAPIINRNAIQAEFKNAKANQLNSIYDYQKTILNGYIEVYNEMSNIRNIQKFYDLKYKQAETLNKSIDIAKDLFISDRANYLEVLTVQRDALETQLDLIETKKNQFISMTNIYKALGGGWK